MEAGVYRSDLPVSTHFEYLRTLSLRTVVFLAGDLPDPELTEFFGDGGATLVHMPCAAALPSTHGETVDVVKEALELVLDRRSHPLLLICP